MNPTSTLFRRVLVHLVAVLSLLSAAYVDAAPTVDGPYLTRDPDGGARARFVAGEADVATVAEEHVARGGTFSVPAVGALPAFSVRLRAPEPQARADIRVPDKTPIYVIADTHGEYEIVGQLLQKQRIIDAALRWSFGKGHLVILGDVFDRGPNQVEILWLLYELQAQAAKAGGGVHLLIGNHEAMVMSGDLRYLNPKYLRSAQVLGVNAYSELLAENTVLGQWLRTRPAVLRIRDWLCLHGGISPQLVERGLTLQQINATVRAALSGEATPQVEFVMGPLGPLWYRGYFPEARGSTPATLSEVDRALAHFNVSKIAVGHTSVPTVTSLYEGRVIAVQVYPHRDAQSGEFVMEALRIDGAKRSRATIDGRLEPLQ